MITDVATIQTRLARRVNSYFPSAQAVVARLSEGKRLKFYLGIDPTSSQLHLGHAVPLLLLKDLNALGHEIILLIGDFTARIGDPTDKLATRVPLTEAQIKANMRTYLEQVEKILPKRSFTVKYNSRWLAKMNLADILQLGSLISVQQLLARDMFQERIKQEKTISVNEFLYPLLQGYDSVALKVDGEVGGNDQLFNMLVGRTLEDKLLNKDKIVLTTHLLVDVTSGKKISKSEGGLIAINDSPQDMFGKTMANISDGMVKTVFELCTEKSGDEIDGLASGHPKDFKIALAYELVRMYHGKKAASNAQTEFEKVFSEGKLPSVLTDFPINQALPTLLEFLKAWLEISATEAKRLVEQKAVQINQQLAINWDQVIKAGDIVQVGPHRFVRAN